MLYEIICCLLCVFAVYGIYCAAREVYFLLMTRGGRSEDEDGDEESGSGCEHNCIACRGCTVSHGDSISEKSSEESQQHNVSEEKASKD